MLFLFALSKILGADPDAREVPKARKRVGNE